MTINLATLFQWKAGESDAGVPFDEADITAFMPPIQPALADQMIHVRITLRRYARSYTLAAFVGYPEEVDEAAMVGVYDDIALQGGGGWTVTEEFTLLGKFTRAVVDANPAKHLSVMRSLAADHYRHLLCK